MFERGATIGILGGGQLGRMLGHAAQNLGFNIIIFDPSDNCPASQICNKHIIANFNDEIALKEFAKQCDIVTFEFENIPLSAAKIIEENNKLFPNSKALELTQDRLIEKNFINSLGLKCAKFFEINNIADLENAFSKIDFPAILKTRRFGYDGKGQYMIKSPDMIEIAWNEIGRQPAILEALVQFEFETSIIIARNINGEIIHYTSAQNIHENGILRKSIVPAKLSDEQIILSRQIGEKIAKGLDYIGVLAVELFIGDEIIVNEIAPRVHNSGHWTIEGTANSQFANHIRAIAGLPLGNTTLKAKKIEMENLLGDEILNIPNLLNECDIYPHDYGKNEIKAGRKMGHVTKLIY